jgi:hypothetical protein
MSIALCPPGHHRFLFFLFSCFKPGKLQQKKSRDPLRIMLILMTVRDTAGQTPGFFLFVFMLFTPIHAVLPAYIHFTFSAATSRRSGRRPFYS